MPIWRPVSDHQGQGERNQPQQEHHANEKALHQLALLVRAHVLYRHQCCGVEARLDANEPGRGLPIIDFDVEYRLAQGQGPQ